MTILEAEHAYNCKIRLNKLSNKLHRLDEQYCNGEIEEPKYFNKQNKLMKDAQVLADEMSKIYKIKLRAFHQGDPRGASLYLIDKTMDYTNYHNGIACY